MPFAPGYPYLNQIFGDAAYEIKLVSLNAGIPIGDNAEIYGMAPGATNTRPRSRTIACRTACRSRIRTPRK